MRRLTFVSCLLLATIAFAPRALAQDQPKPAEPAKAPEPPAHFYHLELVVQELGTDHKPVNSRTYTTTVSTDYRGSASIRTNSKIPIVTGSMSSANSPALTNTQFQYQDIGVNIDIRRTQEVGRQLSFDVTANVSSVAETDPHLHEPIIRQNQWQAVVLIPIGKPTVVCTSDTLDSKGSMQLVVTATPLQ
jgi:hypothetical protein